MMQCSEKAFAMCPESHICGLRCDAIFTEDSECAEYNRHVEGLVNAACVVRCGVCARTLDLGHSDYVLCRGRVVFRDGYCADGVRL